MDDNQLLQRFYEFDETAFDELMKRWRPKFRKMFWQCGIGRDEAEDLLQELAVRIYLTRERLAVDTRLPVAPYLRTMARNLAAGALSGRVKGSNRALTSAVGLEERTAEPQSPVPAAVLRDIEVAFSRLSEVEQNYLLLCKEHGMGELTHGEIAERLGTSSQYISQVSKRALARIRKQLRGQGYRIQIDG